MGRAEHGRGRTRWSRTSGPRCARVATSAARGTGETATESGQRVALALLDHAEAAGDDDVLLVVGHGLSLRVAALLLMGLDYSHARLFGGLRNCHWVVLRPGAEHWRMLAYNVSAEA